jgi:hypothetical protein
VAEPPALVARYLERALVGEAVPEVVRIEQEGRMWMKPGGRALRFKAVEEFDVRRVAFSWKARFPWGLRVSDGYSEGAGKLDVRFLGLPLQRQAGPELNEGEALRYLAELPWVPHAMTHNPELEWRALEQDAVEVVRGALAARFDFDTDGDIVRASSQMRRYEGERRPWGGEYSDYRVLDGLRLPTSAEVYWELPAGRFVYWRGRVLTVQAGTAGTRRSRARTRSR